ncbi:MAG: hypothetical protein ACE149_16600 [Armatimonadota bacterium]
MSATQTDLREMGVWGAPLRVEFGDRYEDVWLQTIGDRTEALERGHEAMQRKLLEFRPGSERAEALKQALILSPPEDVVELGLAAERSAIEARVQRELPEPVQPRQDRAAGETDEAFARRCAEHELRCEEISLVRTAKLQEMLEARRRELLSLSREELAERAFPRRVDIECWNAFARTCDDWVLLRAVRRSDDHSAAYFSDIGEVQALHPQVKEQLRRAYRELEPAEAPDLPKPSAAGATSG